MVFAYITDVTQTNEHKGGVKWGWNGAIIGEKCAAHGEGVHPNPPFAYDSLLYCYNGVIISAHVRVHIYPVVLYMFMNVKRRKRTLYVLCNWYKLVRKLVSLHCEFKTKKTIKLCAKLNN